MADLTTTAYTDDLPPGSLITLDGQMQWAGLLMGPGRRSTGRLRGRDPGHGTARRPGAAAVVVAHGRPAERRRHAAVPRGRDRRTEGCVNETSSLSDPAAVAVELERLRGTVEAGFARVDGALALLVQRSDQSDKQLADHERRLDSLERARRPIAGVGALATVATAVVAAWELTAR